MKSKIKVKFDDKGRRKWNLEEKRQRQLDEVHKETAGETKIKRTEEVGYLDGNRELKIEGVKKIVDLKKLTDSGKKFGFYCELCELEFHDSGAWVDHQNGKMHNRMMGSSLQVKKKSVYDVKNKLKELKERSSLPTVNNAKEELKKKLEMLENIQLGQKRERVE